VDNAWEQEKNRSQCLDKLDNQKMLAVGAAESHTACPEPVEGSGARFVRRFFVVQDSLPKKDNTASLTKLFHGLWPLARTKNTTC